MSLNTNEFCEKLQSQERRVKITCLEQLQRKCVDSTEWTDNEVQQIFDECYLHLLKCYTDRFESVRDHAILTVNIFMERLPPNDFNLQNIISTLAERMGQQETVEESEEIRYACMQQLNKLQKLFVETGNTRSLQDCYEDIVRIILKALKDPYPAVQREACACVAALASTADTYMFQQFAEPLSKGLYGMLNHKHSQARIACVNALGFVALHINASGDALSRLVMEISPLLMDSMPLVRRECGELGVRLLLDLRDRYSYFERLIPLVLCCLKDDSPEVREYIRPLWIKCGEKYYEENEAELSKQEIADLPTSNYPTNVDRPTIGCRAIVQRSLRIVKLITRESSDWKENVRLHSLKLLYQFVLHAEASMTAKFFEIYADVARACRDSENLVVSEAYKVADLMGRLLNYDDWYEHGFNGLERNAKEGYLKCFYFMYTPALGVKFQDNLRLMELLVQPEFSQTLKCEFQMYTLKMVETVLDKTHHETIETIDDKSELYKEIVVLLKNAYISTIKILALSLESEQSNSAELQTKGNSILDRIAGRRGYSLDDLHEEYFKDAIDYVDNIDCPLDAFSEPILLFYGLLKLGKFREPYLCQLQHKANVVFDHCADESKIKIFTAISIAMLDWSATIRRPTDVSWELLKQFVKSVVEPHLVWKAGANAEAMRSLATATLCSLSQGAAEEAHWVLPSFAKYIPSLLEDQAVTTRHYAVKCLYNFGATKMEDLKPIAYACLQRLDDPSSGIRILAASVIPQLEPKFGELTHPVADGEEGERATHELGVWNAFIKHCLDLLFLHYDGPEIRLQAAVKETIMELSKRHPIIAKECYERTLASTHSSFSLKELSTALPFTN